MWVGTFHGLCHRLLRAHFQEAGLPQGFQILDSDDQLRVVKRVVRELDLDEAKWPPRQAQWWINAQKDEGRRAQHVDAGKDPYARQMLRIYTAYEEACRRSGSVDFAELLLRAHELWRDRADILHHYRERFAHIPVRCSRAAGSGPLERCTTVEKQRTRRRSSTLLIVHLRSRFRHQATRSRWQSPRRIPGWTSPTSSKASTTRSATP
jgi:hypothetical protein